MQAEGSTSRGWIESRRFDLAAFILVPVSSIVVLGAVVGWPYGWPLIVICTYFVAIPHYLSSFTFFFGDDNLAHFRSRATAFFIGPILIFVSVILLRLVGLQIVVANTLFVWNIWHVSMQSAGILTIYRNLNRGPATERPFAHRAILLWNSTLAFWFIERYTPLNDWFVAVHPAVPLLVRYTLLAAAVYALGRFIEVVSKRPLPLSTPERAFLVSSFALFLPYLWVKDSNLATFAMLMGHFIQYLSIVWLLHRRKYADADGTSRQRILGVISRRPLFLAGFLVISGLTFYAANAFSSMAGVPWAYVTVWNSLSLIHFYLDGLIWAFRQPYVRTSLGSYIFTPAHVAER